MLRTIPTISGISDLGVDIPEIVEKVNELVEQSNRVERAVGILLHHHFKCVDQLSEEDYAYWEQLTSELGIRKPGSDYGTR